MSSNHKGLHLTNDFIKNSVSPDSQHIILHINHNLDDVFLYNSLLGKMAQVFFVVVPYGNTPVSDKNLGNGQFPIYHIKSIDNEYYICRNNTILSKASNLLIEDMNSLIYFALKDISTIEDRDNNKIIILEDGGYHYKAFEQSRVKALLLPPIIGCVEQTRSGLRKYLNYRHAANDTVPYPVLSVARSNIKTRIESYYISRRTIEIINEMLYSIQQDLSFKKVLLLGYGIIGRNIHRILPSYKCSNIYVVETDPIVQDCAIGDGAHWISEDSIPFDDIHIVIGTTGKKAFSATMLKAFLASSSQELILASVSSRQEEFSEFLSYVDNNPHQITSIINDVDLGTIYQININSEIKTIILLADGFPVNFFIQNKRSLTDEMIDMVYLEMCYLIQLLISGAVTLSPRLYLLGNDEILDNYIDEEEIASIWLTYKSKSLISKEHIWKYFDCHPAEKHLKSKCLRGLNS